MVYHDEVYLALLQEVFYFGTPKTDRTGTGTKSLFSRQMRFDISDGTIPLLTTKKMHWNSIIHEILWYLSGCTNVAYLQKNGVRIWNEWADENGDLGPVYGAQWRRWKEVVDVQIDYMTDPPSTFKVYKEHDQIANVINTLKTNPNDRRMIVNAWNVAELEQMKLPPCHYAFQFYVAGGKLSCMLNQRSCDIFLGVPFNIAQYSILTRMIAEVVGLKAGEFIWNGGDVHLYANHKDQAKEQLSRTATTSPKLSFLRKVTDIDDFTFDDFVLTGYNPLPVIKAKVSV